MTSPSRRTKLKSKIYMWYKKYRTRKPMRISRKKLSWNRRFAGEEEKQWRYRGIFRPRPESSCKRFQPRDRGYTLLTCFSPFLSFAFALARFFGRSRLTRKVRRLPKDNVRSIGFTELSSVLTLRPNIIRIARAVRRFSYQPPPLLHTFRTDASRCF